MKWQHRSLSSCIYNYIWPKKKLWSCMRGLSYIILISKQQERKFNLAICMCRQQKARLVWRKKLISLGLHGQRWLVIFLRKIQINIKTYSIILWWLAFSFHLYWIQPVLFLIFFLNALCVFNMLIKYTFLLFVFSSLFLIFLWFLIMQSCKLKHHYTSFFEKNKHHYTFWLITLLHAGSTVNVLSELFSNADFCEGILSLVRTGGDCIIYIANSY